MYLSELEHRDVSFFYIARDAVGEAVGFCSCWLVLDEIHINNLAVLPEHRRSGVASALIEHVLKEGGARGAHRATLEVRRSNEPARKLYEKFGFAVAGGPARLLHPAGRGCARPVARIVTALMILKHCDACVTFAPNRVGATALPVTAQSCRACLQGGGP